MDQMVQFKDTEWQTGFKQTSKQPPPNKRLQCTGHKRPTVGQRTHTDGKWGQKKILHANGSDKKAGLQY